MKVYTIMWGHDGQPGKHWTTAEEASKYSAHQWGQVKAETAEAAVKQAEKEGVNVGGWYENEDGMMIHVVPPLTKQQRRKRPWRDVLRDEADVLEYVLGPLRDTGMALHLVDYMRGAAENGRDCMVVAVDLRDHALWVDENLVENPIERMAVAHLMMTAQRLARLEGQDIDEGAFDGRTYALYTGGVFVQAGLRGDRMDTMVKAYIENGHGDLMLIPERKAGGDDR